MASPDLTKEQLYESVKTLVETESKHIHLFQQKLFTLYSIAFQYFLFRSMRDKGHYIIRIEDSFLAEKLARKSKDENTRKFMDKLLVPRRLRYQESTFHLDYFNITSWGATSDIPQERIKGALIVKNTSNNPVIDETDFRSLETISAQNDGKPLNYYYTSLMEFVPRTIVIAFEQEYENVTKIGFPFIKDKDKETLSGVKVSQEIDLSQIKE